MTRQSFLWVALLLTLLVSTQTAEAQFSAGTGSVTFLVQGMDHNGRVNNAGHRQPAPQVRTVNVAIAADVDYAVTDRWLASFTVPYIMSKFMGKAGTAPEDVCRCLQDAFADFGFSTHFNVVNLEQEFMVTPFVSVGVPSHTYPYIGEAVVGRRQKEAQLGVDVTQRLDGLLPHLAVDASYGYTFVEPNELVPGISYNRSNGTAVLRFPVRRWLSTRAIGAWQITHGGLRYPCEVRSYTDTNPRFVQQLVDANCPNALNPVERNTEYHRMLRDDYLHVGAGVTFFIGAWDVSGEFLRTALGSNSHDIHVLSIAVGRSFNLRRH